MDGEMMVQLQQRRKKIVTAVDTVPRLTKRTQKDMECTTVCYKLTLKG